MRLLTFLLSGLVVVGVVLATPSVAGAQALLWPFVDVTGGDVVAGSRFSTPGNPCGANNTKAGISSSNLRNPLPYDGAGGQFAAFAMGYIQDFATQEIKPTARPTALSFSNVNDNSVIPNTVSLLNGRFGGMFGSVTSCVDYWGTMPGGLQTLPPLAGDSLSGLASGSYTWTGDLTIRGSSIVAGQQIVIYVEGDVAILPDAAGVAVGYQTATPWASILNIPSVKVIAHGVIYIDNDVRQLDGQYIAVPDGDYADSPGTPSTFIAPRAGTISTCSDGDNFTSYDPTDITVALPACGLNQLTVNGSLVGNQIWLLRMFGSTTDGRPGETINYGPEVWLSPKSGLQYTSKYESVIGLPPIL